jgi:hypothetical protein
LWVPFLNRKDFTAVPALGNRELAERSTPRNGPGQPHRGTAGWAIQGGLQAPFFTPLDHNFLCAAETLAHHALTTVRSHPSLP